MKHWSLRKKLYAAYASLVCGFAAMLLVPSTGLEWNPGAAILISVGMVCATLALVIWIAWLRCPHCGAVLTHGSARHCHHCGEALDWDRPNGQEKPDA